MIKTRRLTFTTVLSLLFFGFVVTRLGYLQIYCHAALSSRAQRERSHAVLETKPRGAIMDRSGAVLATSIQGGACYADPARVKNPEATARALSDVIKVPVSTLKGKLVQRRRFVWLARRLDPEMADQVRKLKLPGISVITEMKRFYPQETLAAQLLGVVGDEGNGLSGVELMADRWLSGRSVPFMFRQWSFKKKSEELPTSSDLQNQSVVLTLDRHLQTIAEQQLAVQMQLSRPKSGTVIIQDPYTGDILAMATAPSFNPNYWGAPGHLADYTVDTLKNPAVEKVVEPGSTFKIVTAAAALEERKVTPNDSFFCEYGNWQIPGRKIHDHEKDGWLTFTEVMTHSSNIGTAKAAMRLGDDTLYRYARAFGFGMPSGCGLPGDGTGILRQTSQWRASSLATISFGQEVGVTPLQMVNAFSVIANGGYLMEPRLYKGVVDENGDYREWMDRKPVRRVVSARTAETLRKILQAVVENGTGKAAGVVGLTAAGKTGTAQKIDPATRQYSADRYLASFCGFAPAEQPRVVIGIFLDEPRTNYWGGSEAAPLFSRIIRDAAPYLRLNLSPVGPLATSRTVSPS